MLKNEKRSLLLIWLLTERLHYESTNNILWKRFLLNQELFEKNLHDGTNLVADKLDLKELCMHLKINPNKLDEHH